ncbi:PspC domain-containing protein [Nocardioides sp. GY 10113]|uniref:PspC domain-containing protein n=1 Tax=Nocardioides sp. GY 10113 TaxID=2569761 RepID=UPI0014584F5B|nr:PspC domain-containing protein [Nocardioides sp. GY 10113]
MTAPPPPPPGPRGPRVSPEEMRDLGRLRRSTTDRKIAGVAGGIAHHLDVDPVLVRVILVVLVFFGGGGLLIYAAGWLLLPQDDGTEAHLRLDERTRTVVLIIAGALAAFSVVGDTVGGWTFPWPLALVGLVVVAAVARNRRPRSGRPPWHAPVPAPGQAPAGTTEAPGQYPGYRPPTTPAGEDGGSTGDEPWERQWQEHWARHQSGQSATMQRQQRRDWERRYRHQQRRDRRRERRGPILFGFALGLAVLLLGTLGTLQLAGADVPASAYPAAVLATCGLMLVVGAFYGRAGGLALIGLLAAAATAVTTAVEPIDAGEVRRAPTSAVGVQDSYELGLGEIVLDLSGIDDLADLDGRTVEVDLRVGHIQVIVPEDGLDVRVDAQVGAGETVLFGEKRGGSNIASHDGGDDVPELTVEADMVVGQIEFETAGGQ